MFRRSVNRLLHVDVDKFRVSASATVAVVTFDSPKTRNAMTVAEGNLFSAAMEDLKARKDVRCIVLTGAGSAFSAGGDSAFLAQRIQDTHQGNIIAMRSFYSKFLSLRDVGVPVIAAINGHAIGAGMCVSLACDIRIVSKEAKLSVNFTKLGIHPGMGATYFLPRLVGVSQASRLLLTGDTIDGADAVRLGIASEALPADKVLERSISIAQDIASNTSRIAVTELVQTLRGDDTIGLDVALEREANAQAACYAEGRDLAEALAAMKEKRTPNFQ